MPTIKEIFESMPQYVNKEKIQGVNKVVQFHITGDEAGDYVVRVQDGELTVEEGTADNADVKVTVDSETWKGILSGNVNGAVAFMTGKLKAEGDLQTLMASQSWFDFPG
nr:SCP2 sterol-binding domain-containing protein [Ardenticatena sp.]